VAERATTPREWALALGGGLALAGVLIWWLRGPEPAPAPAVELTATPPVQLAPVPAPVAAPAPPVSLEGLVLRGVLLRAGGGAAIIERADGRQRLVRLGGMAAPGLRLSSLSPSGARLASADGEHLLLLEPKAEGAETQALQPPTSLAATVNDYRLALQPRREEGRITGWTVRDVSRVPLLQRAGMRPGDVLLAVNGQPLFSSEKLMDIPAEVAPLKEVEVVFERDGTSATVKVEQAL